MNSVCRYIAVVVVSVAGAQTARAETKSYDLVVYGGTSAGVVAAVQAARMGKSVVLIEPGQHLGGLTSGGLGWTDSGNKAVIGGVAREFYQRIKQHYDQPSSWKHGKREQYSRYRAADDAMWTFEPHIAELTFEKMIAAETGITVHKGERLNRRTDVRMTGQRIDSITMESGATFAGTIFMDATYEGDLLAAAGVTYAVGREANTQYDETLNGVQVRQNIKSHRFVRKVDPYRVAGNKSSGLLPGVHGQPVGAEGSADKRVQAYCFRLCMSNVAENRVPFPKPKDYNPLRYELLLRNFEAGDLRLPLKPDMMPNGKTDTNNNCAFSTDNLGMNYDYPEASYARRAEIVREHESYQKGLMWTLANHPRVPNAIRQKMSQWGLAKDEFLDHGNWPHQLYIREARRMVSEYVMTEHDCRRNRIVKDSVGLGSYNMDSHNVQRYVTAQGWVQNEGDVQVSPGGPYLIGYRSIVPRRGEAENLLVPVCLSASHIAYGSIRMEPVFMVLGQSSATAAVLAMDEEIPVQQVDYAKLRERLLSDGQVLDLPPLAVSKNGIAVRKLAGVVIDDSQARVNGIWTASRSVWPFVAGGYRHDGNVQQGQKRVSFEARLTKGAYEVRYAYTPHVNRASNVAVTIVHAEGETVVQVNQRLKPKYDGLFVSLGTFVFSDDKPAVVIVKTTGANGFVIIDAVQFLPGR